MMSRKRLWVIILSLFVCNAGLVQAYAQALALKTEDGKLKYQADGKGNRVLDFSYCGYKCSEADIPDVKSVVFIPHQEGDSSEKIQKAIDYASSLPADKDGFRGAVLLDKGTFSLDEPLRIRVSGVVIRGMDKKETVLLKKGVDRGALIYMEGEGNLSVKDSLKVTTPYVPVNSRSVEVVSAGGLKKGDRIQIVRLSTKEWIASLGCDIFGGGIGYLGWKPGEMDITWDRTVTDVSGNRITFDAPLTFALDRNEGATYVLPYQWEGRIAESGVENMTLTSAYDTRYPKDENHCWTGVSIENAENCWVRCIDFNHFAGSAVMLQPTASRVTVEDCISRQPVSEIGGMRRSTFFTMGQLTLFQRCYSEQGIHDFTAGYCAAGPNAFVQCDSYESFGYSGSIDSWACGLLFDIVNIDGHNLTFKNLGQEKNGAGWNTSNSMFWQCTASEIECYSPTNEAVNRAYGCWGQFSGNGEWAEANNHITPRSLFYAQLAERTAADLSQRGRILPRNTNASSSPTVEEAMQLAEETKKPRLTLEAWINQGAFTASVLPQGVKTLDDIRLKQPAGKAKDRQPVEIVDGKITQNGKLLAGARQEVPWWSGKLRTPLIEKAKPHLTRFVPGREGTGLTDRIDSVIGYMKQSKVLVIDHNYGLWTDRRRDDHERIRRRDGDAWGPFYEQPFSRSGQGTAWDGMSKYDLNRPNAWYWNRLREFAVKGESEGLLLFNQNYFQHNILEAGAHWVDCPWRTANNINNTGFSDPDNFAGDKRIFVADAFYDVSHPVRRELHRKYIRQCLDNFAGCSNVIQLIGAEFTGPLHFVQFWLDEIAAWQAETGKDALIALSTTKDVQDAILNDPKRAAIVDIIDIRYWHYKHDGTVYAPEGGKNLAPRQHARKMKVGKVTFDEAYKAVNEYRQRYPGKAVTYYAQNYPDMAWAVLMAGGSCPVLPVADEAFLKDVALMQVSDTGSASYKMLEKPDGGCVVYAKAGVTVPVQLPEGRYQLRYIEPETGKMTIVEKALRMKDSSYTLTVPEGKEGTYWFSQK